MFIELNRDGDKISINTDKIVAVYPSMYNEGKTTRIMTSAQIAYEVSDSYEEVINKL